MKIPTCIKFRISYKNERDLLAVQVPKANTPLICIILKYNDRLVTKKKE